MKNEFFDVKTKYICFLCVCVNYLFIENNIYFIEFFLWRDDRAAEKIVVSDEDDDDDRH